MFWSAGRNRIGIPAREPHRRVYSRDEISDLIGSRVLASIPTSANRTRGIFNSASPQQDAFARLRTNLSIYDSGAGINKIMVTSAEPGAGKSTIAANLGAALARDGAESRGRRR